MAISYISGNTMVDGNTVTPAKLNSWVNSMSISCNTASALGRKTAGTGTIEEVSATAAGQTIIARSTLALQQSLLAMTGNTVYIPTLLAPGYEVIDFGLDDPAVGYTESTQTAVRMRVGLTSLTNGDNRWFVLKNTNAGTATITSDLSYNPCNNGGLYTLSVPSGKRALFYYITTAATGYPLGVQLLWVEP